MKILIIQDDNNKEKIMKAVEVFARSRMNHIGNKNDPNNNQPSLDRDAGIIPLHNTNTTLLDVRDCSVCKNLYCPSVVEYSLEQEFCPLCNKLLSKTIKGSNLFVVND